ncbi:hypothetical protein [Nonomuraea angiospora]|uniref:hypothetical protein n=1 Tax=Nonomuraea angiospora TaxID=46172 RepID=UPI0029BE92B4|nr:hypothetical protein [Nonomuraea angiospora]MDX3107298.1 hypothetical protein [Nonomuraea angiospora]
MGQAHLVDGADQPLDLPVAVRLALLGEHRADAQIGHHLFQVQGSEVGAVVEVEDVGDAAHVPV